MRVLITGASGFLGSALVHGLAAAGHEVVALLRSTSADHRLKPLPDGVVLQRAADAAGAAQAVRETEPDAVIHTACSYGRHGESFAAVAEVNLGFGLAVADAAIAAGVPRFLNTDTVLDRHANAYALSKKQFAEWGRWLAEQGRIRFCNLLLQHMYGPFDDDSKFSTHVLRACRANIEALALTPGQQRRDFIHIDDVVAAYRCVLESPSESGWQEVEVGSGEAPTLESFVRLVHRLTGSRTRLEFGAVPYRAGEALCCVADTTALRDLGWKPRYALEDGLRQTLEMEFPE
jgi:CDP-paratose synthetase